MRWLSSFRLATLNGWMADVIGENRVRESFFFLLVAALASGYLSTWLNAGTVKHCSCWRPNLRDISNVFATFHRFFHCGTSGRIRVCRQVCVNRTTRNAADLTNQNKPSSVNRPPHTISILNKQPSAYWLASERSFGNMKDDSRSIPKRIWRQRIHSSLKCHDRVWKQVSFFILILGDER